MIIKLLEELFNITYIGTDEDGVHRFKRNEDGEVYWMQIVSPSSMSVEMQRERVPVPEEFYKAFSEEE